MYRLEPGEQRKFRIMKFEEISSTDNPDRKPWSPDSIWNTCQSMVGITSFPEKHPDPLYMALFCTEKDAQLVCEILNANLDWKGL